MRSRVGVLLVLAGLLLAAWGLMGAFLGSSEGETSAPAAAGTPPPVGLPPRLVTASAGAADEDTALPTAAPGARREVDVGGLVGHVLGLEDGAPVQDAWVELCGPPRADLPPEDPRILAEAGTDASGRFVLPWPEEPGSWVRVRAPYGWVWTEPWWLPAPPAPGGGPLEFRLRRGRRAPLEIALKDIRTGEIVPHFVVRVRDWHATVVDIATDEHGRGVSELELLEGRWELTLLDDLRVDGRVRTLREDLVFEALPQGEVHELAIPVGPTWWLDLRGPPDLDPQSLGAFLAGESGDVQPPWAGDSSLARVRTELHGAWPWVRFHELRVGSRLGQDQPLFLVVVDRTGTLHGEAPVEATWGVHPEPVRIELRRTGALTVDVRDRESRAVEDARLFLRPAPEGVGQRTRTGSDGTARFDGLPEGDYLLRVGHNVHAPTELRLRVDGGHETTRRVVLAPAAPAGDVEGRVFGGSLLRATAPGLVEQTKVLLVSLDGAGRSLSETLSFEERGDELVAAFRFEDVPAGEYVLRLSAYKSSRWWPNELVVRPPASGLELRELPRDALLSLELRAVELVSGEQLERSWLWLQSDALPPPVSGQHRADEWIQVPRGASFSWGLGAPGHVPRFGDEGDLREGEYELSAIVALEPGFGVRLDVVDAEGEPVAGASVVVDGEVAGRTDDQGRYLLLRDVLPASIEVRHGGWTGGGAMLQAMQDGRSVCEVRLGGGGPGGG